LPDAEPIPDAVWGFIGALDITLSFFPIDAINNIKIIDSSNK
jgi:hypothetical protein